MEDNAWQLVLDSKRVDAKEVRAPTLFPVSIIATTILLGDDIVNLKETRDKIKNNILKKFSFKQYSLKTFKEGFLEFIEVSENEIVCFYGKETPTKVMFEANDLKIHTHRFSLLNPAYVVRIKIIIQPKHIRVITFGGQEQLIAKASDQLNRSIVGIITGSHSIIDTKFNKEEMNGILGRFGKNVEYIWVHPGDSREFVKFAEQSNNGEISKVPEYLVHAKLHGFHITGAPFVLSLIQKSGIFFKEIQGSLPFGLKKPITARISSEGKAVFFIPETAVPEGGSAYEVAENLYEKIIIPFTNINGVRQTTFGDFTHSEFENEITMVTLLEMTSEQELREVDFCKRLLKWGFRDKNNIAISTFLHKAYNLFIFDEPYRLSLLKTMHEVFGGQPLRSLNEIFKDSTIGQVFVIYEYLLCNQVLDLQKLTELTDLEVIKGITEKSAEYMIPTSNRVSLDITNNLLALKTVGNIDSIIATAEFLLNNRLLKKNELTILGIKTLYEASKSPLVIAKSSLFSIKQPESYLFFEYKQLIDEYASLVESGAEEPPLQAFFERNPFFLNPQYLKCLPKKSFGGELYPDFVLELYDKTTLVIEIEKPAVKLYTAKGDPTKELGHAEQQVRNYLGWAVKENNFLSRHGIENIAPDKTTGILVIGSNLNDADSANLCNRNNTQHGFVVKTFSDVLNENIAILENLKKMSYRSSQDAESKKN